MVCAYGTLFHVIYMTPSCVSHVCTHQMRGVVIKVGVYVCRCHVLVFFMLEFPGLFAQLQMGAANGCRVGSINRGVLSAFVVYCSHI